MAEPRVPGGDEDALALSCGERIDPHTLDMGLREVSCDCGERHAVVLDVHPPSRFVPESLVAILRETVEPADDFEQFGTAHLLGMAMEEFPEEVAVEDASDDGEVGYALVWVTSFDSRRLHEVVVELVVELMEHAVSHAAEGDAFVEQYRRERDFDDEFDSMV
jgi:hypothetical protein